MAEPLALRKQRLLDPWNLLASQFSRLLSSGSTVSKQTIKNKVGGLVQELRAGSSREFRHNSLQPRGDSQPSVTPVSSRDPTPWPGLLGH